VSSFAEYLSHRVAQLVESGEAREAIHERMQAATGLDGQTVQAALDGTDPAGVSEAGLYARALGLDEIEATEVCGDGQLLSRYFDGGGDLAWVFAPQTRLAGDKAIPGQTDFIASTGREARDGDMIDQASWRLGPYHRNPVVLWNHDLRTVVGTAKSRVVTNDRHGEHLTSTVTWDTSDLNPEGQRAADQHQRRIRRGISVSWIAGKQTKRSELPEDDPRYTSKARKIQTRWGPVERMGSVHFNSLLIEQSSVSVPSDPRALQTRGLGPAAGLALRAVDHTDGPATDDVRTMLRALAADPDLWADADVLAALAAPVRSLIRTNADVRAALRGLIVSTAPETATPTFGTNLLDYFTTKSEG